jgi:NAD(P)-dependent dehydrogenase (short-subunit alcohol dehydrogenase family)
MISKGIRGSIVNISSIGGQRPTIFANAHYEAAKAGLDALTRAAAVEFAHHKIRINGVAPGAIRTEGLDSIEKSVGLRGPAAIPGRKLLGIAEPLEIARAVLFVASPAASHMTGQIIAVDGGFLVG